MAPAHRARHRILSSLPKLGKRAALGILKGAGALRSIRNSAWRTARLPILYYHGIAMDDEDQWDPSLFMSLRAFEGRMKLLKEGGYNVLNLREGVRRLCEGSLEPRTVVITFDDGLHDFHAQALSVLLRFGFPATVYLTTFYCDFNRPVFPVFCSYLLWKAGAKAALGAELVGVQEPLDFASEAGRAAVLAAINSRALELKWTAAEKDEVALDLAHKLDVDFETIRAKRILHLMTPSEVSQCAAAGIDIELHTHRHRTPADESLFIREIRDNRDRVRQITGRNPVHFCYPSGVYSREFLPWLRAEGVETATTCENGLAEMTSDPLLLPRVVDTSNLSDLEFEACVSGAVDRLGWKRRATSAD
jgi:peptidoglycan/xylan/chitin deacetylase (PgdA/CDA1 family)